MSSLCSHGNTHTYTHAQTNEEGWIASSEFERLLAAELSPLTSLVVHLKDDLLHISLAVLAVLLLLVHHDLHHAPKAWIRLPWKEKKGERLRKEQQKQQQNELYVDHR